jgi:YfiH family protein
VTPGSLGSLNLGWYTDDDPENVRENYRRLGADLNFDPTRIAAGYQVHGTAVLRVAAPGQTHGFDAFVTDEPGIVLSVTVADCTPILLFDPVRRAVAAAHAGWRGTVGGIAGQTLAALRTYFGTDPADCLAYIGACIGAADYQVDADVAAHFPAAHQRWSAPEQKYYVDLKGYNQAQLLAAGLPPANISVSPYSTLTQAHDFFSHRAAGGRAGRGIALIGLR